MNFCRELAFSFSTVWHVRWKAIKNSPSETLEQLRYVLERISLVDNKMSFCVGKKIIVIVKKDFNVIVSCLKK